jgi:cytochrome c oxidase subunit 3
MSIILTFLAVIAAIAGWWLSRQRLLSKPWLETGLSPAGLDAPAVSQQKVGLWVFLAVVGGLFALFGSAFVMRNADADWQRLPMPPLIWVNTAVLVLSSVYLRAAVRAARRHDARDLRTHLATGGALALMFLFGQLLALRALAADGYVLALSPSSSFFYLITGLHGLHILGGLAALGLLGLRLNSGAGAARLRLGVELCATYWHFLLGVWVAALAVMLGWARSLIEICGALLS